MTKIICNEETLNELQKTYKIRMRIGKLGRCITYFGFAFLLYCLVCKSMIFNHNKYYVTIHINN